MLFYKLFKKPTPSGGAWSMKLSDDYGKYDMQPKLIRQIYFKSATASTTFNAVFTNADGVEFRRFLGVVGVSNDLTPTPTQGDITIAINSATSDEEFEVFVIFSDT